MFGSEEGKLQIRIHTKIGKLQLEQAFHDNFCWENFVAIVLPKPFGTFRNTLPEQHGTPGILKGEETNRRNEVVHRFSRGASPQSQGSTETE